MKAHVVVLVRAGDLRAGSLVWRNKTMFRVLDVGVTDSVVRVRWRLDDSPVLGGDWAILDAADRLALAVEVSL